ncbi:TetR/AcrR family transcriptional regulator [Agromyces sp. SYSU K20354]|uniref:TetR/AcrR family transcriptional regulator n=1 Tax=Agromyces cavernae TaxID=2898659 RepID=UPI001E394E66|nr:TetR/AcrR family transcriptional regulator [Agromyces cavernae]MCD2444323.1 TetR/AcrR family transcriptional regulator [Agromyces cavernae]
MARRYEQKVRAEQQEQTRRRIVGAALELHRTVGPAASSFSAVADRAGVQRSTLYRHFPDDRALFLACSGQHLDEHPFPDPASVVSETGPEARAALGLGSLYRYWEEHETLVANVLRDGETDPVLHEVNELRMGAPIAAMRDLLVDAWPVAARTPRLRAMVALALDFRTWQTLVRRSGMATGDAAALMSATLARTAIDAEADAAA